ncbi:MAG: 3-isopropylmalate dehydratase small subunit [Syntrophales bacterium]|nr:3-isopropylmalate dehydratase small subunit [Syntrophales bacterium]
MKFKGRIWKFGDNVDTDQIIPARYLNISDPAHLARHVMEDADPTFPEKVKPGDIIVAGENFGCGSSREHAPIAIKASGIACVVAKSFARIFYRNAFNMGLPIFESPDIFSLVSTGDCIEVDGDQGIITILGEAPRTVKVEPIPPFMQELIRAGGLIKYIVAHKTKKVLGGE